MAPGAGRTILEVMVHTLSDNPVLLLFLVIAVGFVLGRVRIAGFSFGIAAVLFAGLAAGAIDPRLMLPEPIWVLGLALFVYTVGLEAGPGFFAALRRRGVGSNLLVLGCLATAAAVAIAVGVGLLALSGAVATGIFAGGMTNTPALAAAVEAMKGIVPPADFDRLSSQPVAGYSLAYPLGVVIPLLAAYWLMRRQPAAAKPRLVTETALVERSDLPPLGEIREAHHGHVQFGRLRHGRTTIAAADRAVLSPGDLITLVGTPASVATVVEEIGTPADEPIDLDRHEVDFRRIVVSRKAIAGMRIEELDLQRRFDGTITRVRRGDTDLLADPHMVLELGDRVRVVAPRRRLPDISDFFGDSYRALGEVDVLTFALGLAAGITLGLIPFPFPGPGSFELGSAGGPLLVALVLGALGRTGPFVWQIPHGANLTLRQLGIVLFLAGIGTRAGQTFGTTIADSSAIAILAAGTLVTTASVVVALVVGLRILRLDSHTLAGVVAGIQTQPAVLAFATERTTAERDVNLGYASVYPLAVITKIVVAQVMLRILLG